MLIPHEYTPCSLTNTYTNTYNYNYSYDYNFNFNTSTSISTTDGCDLDCMKTFGFEPKTFPLKEGHSTNRVLLSRGGTFYL
jgi:hypothetical protein